jgi:hypothetical protein
MTEDVFQIVVFRISQAMNKRPFEIHPLFTHATIGKVRCGKRFFIHFPPFSPLRRKKVFVSNRLPGSRVPVGAKKYFGKHFACEIIIVPLQPI